MNVFRSGVCRLSAVIGFVLALACPESRATTLIGEWVPQFKGIDLSVSTNIPNGDGFPNLHVVYALRVDLTEPDIRLFTTPAISNHVAGAGEVGGLTVSRFLSTNGLQAAINANFFGPGAYYLPAGTPMDVYGVSISEGVVVSTSDGPRHAAALLFDAANRATVLHTNWPPASIEGIYTAVCGDYPLVVGGKNVISPTARERQPRTVFGLSEDRRYLYLVAIDGRQPGYSEGANDYESAGWLLLLGAHDGVNMDGGGSTTLVIEDSTGIPIRINRSSAVADSGRERTVGSHFGVYAKPLPGFINDVMAAADDTTARITWNTVEPSTSEVQYGRALEFGSSSGIQSDLVTQHMVQLTELTPNTGYYFRILSSTAEQNHVSRNFFFRTKNYITATPIFGFSKEWKHTSTNVSETDWASPGYDDSDWSGPEPGLLWVDVRADGANSSVEPKVTAMSADPGTGFPYFTYFFRTHFDVATDVAGRALAFSGYIDDGAIFYLNGHEVYRLRMPSVSTAETLASDFPCDGDATCLDEFTLQGDSLDHLRIGDNVLAVEVHNYNARSADITFGLALVQLEPVARNAALEVQYSVIGITLTWKAAGFMLQSANSLEGPWSDIPSTSPFITSASEAHRYFRLRN